MKTNQTEIILIRPLRDFHHTGAGYNAPRLTAGKLYPAIHATNQPEWKERGKIFVAFDGTVPDGETDSILLAAPDYDRVYPDFPVSDYLAAAMWTMPDNGAGPGEFDGSDAHRRLSARVPGETRQRAQNDCLRFLALPGVWGDLERSGLSPKQAAHNFWLSRNDHGTGFFDRETEDCDAYEREQVKAVESRDFSARDALTDTCNCPYHACQRLQRAAKSMGVTDLYRGRGGWLYFE